MRLFGLLIDWVSSHYHQQVWGGIDAFCRQRGVNLLTLVTGRPGSPFVWEQMRNQLLEFVRHDPFDGFLFMTATLGDHLTNEQFASLLDRVKPAPVVSIGNPLECVPSVVIDNGAGMSRVLEHLHDVHGYRKYAFAGGSVTNRDARERRACLLRFLSEHELEIRPERLLDGEFTMDWGREAVNHLIPGVRPDFDVLVCASDEIALGVLEALARRDLQVPGDVAVTGFDDRMGAALAAITTANQPLRELGRAAAERLWNAIESGEPPTATVLDTRLVVRQTCGCLSPAARETRVEPRANFTGNFDELYRAQQERLVQELSNDGLPERFTAALAEAFTTGWQQQDSRIFLHGLQRVLSAMAREGFHPGQIHYPLSVLRRWVLRATEPASKRAFAEACIHQARIVLTESIHVQTAHRQTRQQMLGHQLSDLNERLLYSRSLTDQAVILGDVLPKIGITRYRLALYEDPTKPTNLVRLVVTEQGEVPDGGAMYDPKQLLAAEPGTPEPWSFVAEALFDQKDPLGFLLLENLGDPEQLSVFDQLSERVGRGIETVRRIHDLEAQVAQRTAELRELALRDELTGLYNRRGFLTLAEHQLKARSRKGHSVTLFFADLDGLKIVNDTWGHEAGDEAIRTTARLLGETFRAEDIVARLGGDEFVVLAPDSSPHDARGLVERLRSAFARAAEGRFGISVGWISVNPAKRRPLTEWMRDADSALYREKQAKKAGQKLPQPK
jgi:diguanylate cyclase (GGDEF)-like protein